MTETSLKSGFRYLLYPVVGNVESRLLFFMLEHQKEGGIDMTQYVRGMFTSEVENMILSERYPDQTVKKALGRLVKLKLISRVNQGRYKVNEGILSNK